MQLCKMVLFMHAWGNGRIINGNEEPIEIPVKTNLQKIIE